MGDIICMFCGGVISKRGGESVRVGYGTITKMTLGDPKNTAQVKLEGKNIRIDIKYWEPLVCNTCRVVFPRDSKNAPKEEKD